MIIFVFIKFLFLFYFFCEKFRNSGQDSGTCMLVQINIRDMALINDESAHTTDIM